MATKAGSTPYPSYEDFEPLCKWKTELEQDTLEVHLNGFKKDQMKVQINNIGILTITGERPLQENKWSRFRKEIQVSTDCKTNEIRARFSAVGVLYITMPKRTPLIAQDPEQKEENEKPKPVTNQDKDSTIRKSSAKENVTKPRNYVTRVVVTVAVVLTVALGAYMTYKYRQSYTYRMSSQDEN